MANPLISKLERFTRLSPDDRVALNAWVERRVRRLRPREHLIHEGDRPGHVSLIVEGWAARYKILADGRRQSVGFLLPGDLCDLNADLLDEVDHSVAAVTPLSYAQITRDDIDALVQKNPRIIAALWKDTLVTAAIQREWTVSLGQRSAIERVAHLLVELFHRLRLVGLTNGVSCDFPLKQTEMADALGITPVHTNRVFQALRHEHLVELSGRRLVIPDLSALGSVALFNPNYLHLNGDARASDGNE